LESTIWNQIWKLLISLRPAPCVPAGSRLGCVPQRHTVICGGPRGAASKTQPRKSSLSTLGWDVIQHNRRDRRAQGPELCSFSKGLKCLPWVCCPSVGWEQRESSQSTPGQCLFYYRR
jgi:hypothetical protein